MLRSRTSSQSAWIYMCVAVLVGGVVAGVIVSSYTVIFTFAGLGLLYFLYLASASEDVHAVDRARYPAVTPERAPKPDPDVPLEAPKRSRRVATKPPPAATESEKPAPPSTQPAPKRARRKGRRFFSRRRRRNPDGSTKGIVPELRPWKWRRKHTLDEDLSDRRPPRPPFWGYWG